MRVLTILSVLILPLTFVASLWGMNVRVPFGDAQFGFEILAGIMLTVRVATPWPSAAAGCCRGRVRTS